MEPSSGVTYGISPGCHRRCFILRLSLLSSLVAVVVDDDDDDDEDRGVPTPLRQASRRRLIPTEGDVTDFLAGDWVIK